LGKLIRWRPLSAECRIYIYPQDKCKPVFKTPWAPRKVARAVHRWARERASVSPREPVAQTVCNFDEDSLTLAAAAAINYLKGFDRQSLDAVYFASTMAPYKERQNAGIIAGALCAPDQVRSSDFTGSLKAGTGALLSALELVAAGSGSSAIVCAGDCRLGKMGSVQELIFGDAGAAILVSDKGVIAEFKGFFSITRDFVDHVRGANSRFDRQWEERWIRDLGYSRFIPEAIKGLCGKYGLAPADFAKVIYPCYFGAARKSINDQLGLSSENVQDDMQATVGDTGAAHSILMPAKALEEANAGTSSSL